MVVPLADPERVGGEVLLRDEPGFARRLLHAAHADALALAQRVKGQADVFAHDAAVRGLHGARGGGEVAVQEFAEGPFADEADPGRVLLLRVRKPDFLRDAAHFRFGKFPHGEDHLGDLLLREAVEEVALVLRRVDAAQKFDPRVGHARAGVVPGRDHLRPHRHRMVEERAELDFRVAEDVGVGRAAGRILAQEVGEDALLVLLREVDGLDLDADHVRHGGRVEEVLTGRTVFAVVVILPVLHEEAGHVVALFLQEPRAHRRVDASGEADHDFFPCHRILPVVPGPGP